MSWLTAIPIYKKKTPDPRQVISTEWIDRDEVLDEDVNLFCWKRTEEVAIQDFLTAVINQRPAPLVFSANQENLRVQLEVLRHTWDDLAEVNGDAFWEDLYQLVHDFLSFSDTHSGTVHLRVIDDNACSKFHVDGYNLRLFTTYIGQGTQWLAEQFTNRKGLGKTNELIIRNENEIQQMKPFEVGILKGEIPGKRRKLKGIVHRSPPIEHVGEKRIILRVDI